MYLLQCSLLSIDSNDSTCCLTISIFLIFLCTPDDLQTSSFVSTSYSSFPLSFGLYRRKRIYSVHWAFSLTYILRRKTGCLQNTAVCAQCHTLCLKLCINVSSHTQNTPWNFYCTQLVSTSYIVHHRNNFRRKKTATNCLPCVTACSALQGLTFADAKAMLKTKQHEKMYHLEKCELSVCVKPKLVCNIWNRFYFE